MKYNLPFTEDYYGIFNENLEELSKRRELEQRVLREIKECKINTNLVVISGDKKETLCLREAINRWKEMLK